MSKNNAMMQIQADFLGIPVLRPSMTETTSLGAAIVGKKEIVFYYSKNNQLKIVFN